MQPGSGTLLLALLWAPSAVAGTAVAVRGSCPPPIPAAAVLLPSAAPVPQDDDALRRRRLEASLLLRLLDYARWPEEALHERAEIVVAVYGPDPFGKILEETFAEARIAGLPVRIRRLTANTDRVEAELARCHVVWVTEPDARQLQARLQRLAALPVLTVGDRAAFAHLGGGVQIFEANNKLQFHINRADVRRSGIDFSSKVLQLSRPAPEPRAEDLPPPEPPSPDPLPADPPPGRGDESRRRPAGAGRVRRCRR